MRAWNKATAEPWAITETALHTILDIANRSNESPEAVAARLGKELQNTHTVTERDGIAILPVIGPLFRYANLFTTVSGATSYEILARDFTTALESPSIKAIILNIDSPGGEVNGCAELASLIYEARGTKPIIAYASGDAASGAYWIASAADQIIASPTSALGSIGVVAVYRTRQNDKDPVTEIVSSQSPYKRLDITSDEGRARLQTRIDTMATVFVSAVARNRGIDPPDVIKRYGSGDVLIGEEAVKAGLADHIGSLEKTITQLSSPQTPPLSIETITTETSMETTQPFPTSNVETIQADAAAQERQRIASILTSPEATGRQPLAYHLAFETVLSPDIALSIMTSSPKTVPTPERTTSSFEQYMSGLGNPSIIPAASDDMEVSEDQLAQEIASYARRG